MTTPAQDAPLVFPSVAFRPLRLLIICAVLTALAILAAGYTGHIFFGVFFGVGLGLGLLNALLVRRAVEAITAQDHPLKKKMAINSATRLLVITAVALAVAIGFKAHGGIAVLFGLAIFQALLVLSTSLPVLKKIRKDGLDVADTTAGPAGTTSGTESKD
ncbi:MAG: ATP synthase subunit I [Mycolicibacterium cosmeticum]|nr:ATP synthase subunit I [Mycolicibacterium cosmeticum]